MAHLSGIRRAKCPLTRDIPFGGNVFGRAAGIPARYDAPDAEAEIRGRSIAARRSAVTISHDADILRRPARLRASGSSQMQ